MKVGKTTFASRLKNNLFIYTEAGLNAIAGVTAIPCTTWSDFKKIVAQLKKPEARELYHTVTIDTVTILWQLCEKYVCAQNDVDTIGDIGYGKGYVLLRQEFDTTLRQISMLGFGIIFIAHSEIGKAKSSDGETDIEIFRPALDKRCYSIVNQMVDVIGYIGSTFTSEGLSERWLWTRETPTIFAGSRFPYLPAKIPFGYESLVEHLAVAIEKQGEEGAVIDSRIMNDFVQAGQTRSFEEAFEEAKNLWSSIVKTPEDGEKIGVIIEEIFGNRIKLSEVKESQLELLEDVIAKMRNLA